MLSAEKIKFLRLLHHITQAEIGVELGVTKNYISMLENRKQGYSEEFSTKWVNAIYSLAQKKEKAGEVAELETEVKKIVEPKATKKTTKK